MTVVTIAFIDLVCFHRCWVFVYFSVFLGHYYCQVTIDPFSLLGYRTPVPPRPSSLAGTLAEPLVALDTAATSALLTVKIRNEGISLNK